jgi:hypothetical protein
MDRGEIWTLFAIFMFIILFNYILIRLRVPDTGSLTIFHLQQPICVKRHSHLLGQLKTSTVVGLKYKQLSVLQRRHWSQESMNLFQTTLGV